MRGWRYAAGLALMLMCGLPVDLRAAVEIREVVMVPGMTIEASNKNGVVSIRYVSPRKREYRWNGKRQVVRMIPRPERFLGMLGVYNPASTWLPFSFRPRLVVQESIRDFASMEEISKFLIQGSAYMDWVYTPDGLTVGFGESPPRNEVDVDVWQILLNGEKPKDIPGARPDQIKVRFAPVK